ncbi:hypothetical protein E8E11_009436 [Didymella keratinophila]|nr:hypothetical protein E8E11_009436 [Didymella keratinophila]
MAIPQPDLIVSRAKRLKFDNLAEIEVGSQDQHKTYTAHHSEALTSRSVFFREPLSGPWKEADERLVRIPDNDIEVFELYLHLVYHNELACTPDPPSDTETGEEERLSLARLYVLCEKLQDIQGKNTVIKALFILDVFAYNVKIEWLDLANYPISGSPA